MNNLACALVCLVIAMIGSALGLTGLAGSYAGVAWSAFALGLMLTVVYGHRAMMETPEPTYCDGCKRFSHGVACPYCPVDRRGS